MSDYILPVFIIVTIVYSCIKGVSAYDSFIKGAKEGVILVLDILPYILSVILAVKLMQVSGLSYLLTKLVTPMLIKLGIPEQLGEFVLLRPFSGSGSLAMLSEIINTYGVDSLVTRSACVVMGSGETVFYVTALYLGATKVKKIIPLICILLTSTLLSIILSSFICKFL